MCFLDIFYAELMSLAIVSASETTHSLFTDPTHKMVKSVWNIKIQFDWLVLHNFQVSGHISIEPDLIWMPQIL